MRKQMIAASALALITTSSDVIDQEPASVRPPEPQLIAEDSRERTSVTLKEPPKRTYMFGHLKPEKVKPLIQDQDPRIRRQLAFVNTHAISCGNWKNKLCEELEEQGIPVAHLKSTMHGSTHLLSDHLESLESFEAFEARILELLQPESVTEHLSREQRLWNATEILARSALGVYQLLYRYYASYQNQPFSGEIGRKNLFRLISSKEEQDELTEIVIRDLAKTYQWNVPVMAADYYGGPKLARPLAEKLKGSTEHDALLYGKRYHGYPSVMAYVDSFEDDIKQFALNEGLDPDNLSTEDKIRFIRYTFAKIEGAFDMQAFERSNKQDH